MSPAILGPARRTLAANWYLSAMISVSGRLTPGAGRDADLPPPSGLDGSSTSFRLSGPARRFAQHRAHVVRSRLGVSSYGGIDTMATAQRPWHVRLC
jgi:hypothetical protein